MNVLPCGAGKSRTANQPFITSEDVRPFVATAMTDGQLQDVINREIDWLELRIGPLSGQIVAFNPYPNPWQNLYLHRPAVPGSVHVYVGGQEVPIRLQRYGSVVVSDRGWYGPVYATWLPNDASDIRRALIRFVMMTLNESDFQMQRVGLVQYQQREADYYEKTRKVWLNNLMRKPPFMSISATSTWTWIYGWNHVGYVK